MLLALCCIQVINNVFAVINSIQCPPSSIYQEMIFALKVEPGFIFNVLSQVTSSGFYLFQPLNEP